MKILWNIREWAQAIAELPAPGGLPCRTVLVPSGATAHALRRELITVGLSRALTGTRFVVATLAAVETLRSAGVSFRPGEEALRRARLAVLLQAGLRLTHFPLDLVRSTPGWDAAFAQSISDLEAAGLDPGSLESAARPGDALRDVAAVWRALDESARHSWTAQRVYLEAAAALRSRPEAWPFSGFVLAPASTGLTFAEAAFLRAIPGCTVALLAARPFRRRYLETVEALLGPEAGAALRTAVAPRAAGSERDLLASYLFEPPSILADPGRPRSRGPDGSVHLEEHAGVESELTATAEWVARQVIDGVPLEEIAVLVPEADPLAGFVATCLERLPWPEGVFPVHVAGGLPLTRHAAGARALSVVRALRLHLPASALEDVLPFLRPVKGGATHLSRGAAVRLLSRLGCAGGNAARPEGALEWRQRAALRQQEMEGELAAERSAGESGDQDSSKRARDLEQILCDLGSVRPALDALAGIACSSIAGAHLSDLWPQLAAFFDEWLLQPGEGPDVRLLLEEPLGALAADAACRRLAGEEALRFVEDALLAARVHGRRFGEPAVYVGSVAGSAGLAFSAVRIIGLAEGHLPPALREDPVIPESLRERLRAGGALVACAADRTLEKLHALDAAVRNARHRIALCAPRLDVERSQREPSSVMLEAAAALARPNRVTGESAAVVPNRTALQRDAYEPAREEAARRRCDLPVLESAWLCGVARHDFAPPRRWSRTGMPACNSTGGARGAVDGLLGQPASDLPVPGLSPEWPVSPSGIERLLRCPCGFLLRHVLGFREAAALPPQFEIGQPAYGELFHSAAAEFYRAHGEAFCARDGTLAGWIRRADETAERLFADFVNKYVLAHEAVRSQQCERLRRDLRDLLEFDWGGCERARLVAVEAPFGRPEPVALECDGVTLYLDGRIDRIDVDGRISVVRDLKTGRSHPRLGNDAAPRPVLDVQIAIYGLVTRLLAGAWNIPERVGAEYIYVGRGAASRSFRDDFRDALEPAARKWLSIAGRLLSERMFPRTPDPGDCTLCAYDPLCGPGTAESHGSASHESRILEDFAALRTAPSGNEEE